MRITINDWSVAIHDSFIHQSDFNDNLVLRRTLYSVNDTKIKSCYVSYNIKAPVKKVLDLVV